MAKLQGKFISLKQDWETPDEVFEPLNQEFRFTTDVCADSRNTKCPDFFAVNDNALQRSWHGVCWMNPPFGEQARWVKKAYEESLKDATVVCLLPARTNTNWWHDYCMKGEIRFLKGRPKFKGAEHGLPQPLAIVIFRKKLSDQAMESKNRKPRLTFGEDVFVIAKSGSDAPILTVDWPGGWEICGFIPGFLVSPEVYNELRAIAMRPMLENIRVVGLSEHSD